MCGKLLATNANRDSRKHFLQFFGSVLKTLPPPPSDLDGLGLCVYM